MTHHDPHTDADATQRPRNRGPVCVLAKGCENDALCREKALCSAFHDTDADATQDGARPTWEHLDTATAEVAFHWAEILHEVVDKGLIYWEPNTARGHAAKADMLRRCEEFLKPYRKVLDADPALALATRREPSDAGR